MHELSMKFEKAQDIVIIYNQSIYSISIQLKAIFKMKLINKKVKL